VVTIMYANNETGVIFPIERLVKLSRQKGFLFTPMRFKQQGRSPQHEKIEAGYALHLRPQTPCAPKELESSTSERGQNSLLPDWRPPGKGQKRRDGKCPLHHRAREGLRTGQKAFDEENTKVRSLRDYLEAKLLEKIPNTLVNGDGVHRLPNTVSVSFEYVEENRFSSSFPISVSAPHRVSLYFRIPGAFACPQGHGGAFYRGPRVDPFQPVHLQHERREWITSSNIFPPSFKVERHLTLLERLSQSSGESLTGCSNKNMRRMA